jgi:hypothetical protein
MLRQLSDTLKELVSTNLSRTRPALGRAKILRDRIQELQVGYICPLGVKLGGRTTLP